MSIASCTTDTDALYRKIAWRLMPFLFFGYVIAYIDRMNVSFAKLQMAGDLGFSDTVYGFGAGIFFLGYFFFEVPSNIMLHKIGARIWLARIMIMWGLISSAMMFVGSPLSFYGLRLLLGMGEAGFFPGIVLYLTYWFPNRYRAKCISVFIIGIAFSGIISGPISGWLMQTLQNEQNLRGWQWLFLLEGLLAVILGCCTPFILQDKPEKAYWLTDDEKQLVSGHLAAEQHAVMHHTSLKETLTNRNIWLLSSIYFLLVAGLYSISFWLPQIIHDFGQDSLVITGLLSSIPYLSASIGMILIAHYSDKHDERYHLMQVCTLVGAIGLIASAWYQSPISLSLFSLSVACTGIMACLTVFWTIPTKILSNDNITAAAGIAMINSVGGLGGGYIGPFLLGWIKDTTHSLSAGLYVLGLGLFIAMMLLMQLRKLVKI